MRKCDIYRHQEQGKWKDNFAPEIARSAVSNRGQATELSRRIEPPNASGEDQETSATSFGGFVTADYNRWIEPEKTRGTTAVSFGSFVTADPIAESNPRE